jgi:hypothetical protein
MTADMSKQQEQGWRTVRVVVEVPVRGGKFSEKDLAWEVKAFTEHNAEFLLRRRTAHVRFGRALVKEFSRVVLHLSEEG